MWPYGWEPLIESHHPVKFDGHKHYGSIDIFLLVVDEQNSMCSLISIITITIAIPRSLDHMTRFKINCTFTKQSFSSVSTEISPALVMRVLGNSLGNIR